MSRSEREKMLAGEEYDCYDAELANMAVTVRHRVAAYNASAPDAHGEREWLLGEIFGAVARGVHVEPPLFVDFGVHTTIGEDTYINVNCVIVDDAPISIGARVLIGPSVQLITAQHPLRVSDRRTPAEDVARGSSPWRTMTAPVTIGDDVWLGAGVIVLPGVTIGDRCTIGAGSVVTKDIPADSVAVGTPAKVVRDLSNG